MGAFEVPGVGATGPLEHSPDVRAGALAICIGFHEYILSFQSFPCGPICWSSWQLGLENQTAVSDCESGVAVLYVSSTSLGDAISVEEWAYGFVDWTLKSSFGI